MTIKEIREAIENITDLSRGKTLKELKAIKHIGINEEKDLVILLIEVGRKGTEAESILKRELAKVIKLDLGFSGVKFDIEECKEASLIAGKNTKFILISGLKGGVGKSTVAINLAYALNRLGKHVGIMDADIYGATIPEMLFMDDASPSVDTINKIIPFNKDGIQIISTYFFSQKESPMLWKGNMLTSMINNFLFQVSWRKDLDYLIIDMPSGTGDVTMDIATLLPDAKAIVVSEEDMISSVNALKTIKAHEEQKQKVLGYIINKYTGNEYASMFLKNKTEYDELAKLDYNKEDNTYIFKEDSKNAKALDDLAALLIIEE